jgi:hypothetical protein
LTIRINIRNKINTNLLNYKNMKNVNFFLVTLAFFSLSVSVAYADDVNTLKTKIESYAHGGTGSFNAYVYGNTLEVKGTVSNAVNALTLNIDAGVKVVWQANLSGSVNGLINLAGSGTGTFEVATGGLISGSHNITIYNPPSSSCLIAVNGGTIINTCADGRAIGLNSNASIIVNSGMVNATGAGGSAIRSASANTTVEVSGGIVQSISNDVIILLGDNANITISGGSITNNGSGMAIVASGSNSKITISDGIVNTIDAPAIFFDGNNTQVTLSGGTIQSALHDAIFSASNNANIIMSGNCKLSAGGHIHSAIFSSGENTKIMVNGGMLNATGSEGYAICCSGKETTISVSGGNVEAAGKSSIYSVGEKAKINVSGGTVGGSAIQAINVSGANSEVTVSENGKVEATDDAIRVFGENITVNINGGTVKTTGDVGSAIYLANAGKNSTIAVNGGTLSAAGSEWSHAICVGEANEISSITVNGGILKSIGEYGTIHIKNPTTNLKLSGGIVTATNGKAIYNESTSTVTISGGIGFAYGTAVTDVINGVFTIPPTNSAVLVAWNKAAGNTTYEAGETDDIYKFPAAAKAVWDKQDGNGGIAVAHNTTAGFISIEGVTITGVGIETITNDALQIYPNPTTGELKIKNDGLQIEFVGIFDISGKKLFSLPSPMFSETMIDISHFSSGVYFVTFTTATGKIERKVIKE